MTPSFLLCIVAAVCLFVFFKVMGFLLRISVIVIAVGAAYWHFAPQFGWHVPF